MKEISVGPEDEAAIGEINILSDGRICIFGTSLPILEMLEAIPLGDPALRRRIATLHMVQARLAAESNEALSAENDRAAGEFSRTVAP